MYACTGASPSAFAICGLPPASRTVFFAGFRFGFGFSFLMDVWEWFSFYPHTWQAFVAQIARGVPFDVAHAAGNLALALAAGPELRRVLDRYGRRLRTEVVWA